MVNFLLGEDYDDDDYIGDDYVDDNANAAAVARGFQDDVVGEIEVKMMKERDEV